MAEHFPKSSKAAPQTRQKSLGLAVPSAKPQPQLKPAFIPPPIAAQPVAQKPKRAPKPKSAPQPASIPAACDTFLRLLCETGDIVSSIKKCGLPPAELYGLLLGDAAFRARFDERANLRLELAALDIAFHGNASLAGFLLSNRLPDRYKKGSVQPKSSQTPQIVFLSHDMPRGEIHED